MKAHDTNWKDEAAPLASVGDIAIAAAGRVKKLPSPVALATPVCRVAAFHSSSLASLVASLPGLVALRESFPGARLSSYARAPLVPLLQHFRALDEAHVRPAGGLSAQAALMAKLHGADYDIALSFSQGANALLLCWATGAGVRAGFVPSHFEAFLTHRVEKSGALTSLAALELARSVGAHSRGASARDFLDIPTSAWIRAETLLRARGFNGDFVAVAPVVPRRVERSRAEREAHLERWQTLIRQLARSWPLVVVAGRAWQIEPEAASGHPIFNLNGKIDVLTLAAVLSRATVVVGDDEGALALADLLERHRVRVSEPDAPEHLQAQVLAHFPAF